MGRNSNEYKGDKIFSNPKKVSLVHSYCKKPGHSIKICYRIHGFPTDFKFTKSKKLQGIKQRNNFFDSTNE